MRYAVRKDWAPIRAEVVARFRAGESPYQIQRAMGLTQSKVSTWWNALPRAERDALRARSSSPKAIYETARRARLRAAEAAARLTHPSLAAIRGVPPSVALFERVLTEVPELTRRACFDLPRQADPLWPLAVWMLRRVRVGSLTHPVIGALYGLGRESIRQIEEVAIERALPAIEAWREHARDADQRDGNHWDTMLARAS